MEFGNLAPKTTKQQPTHGSLFKPEHQQYLREFIASTASGDVSKASNLWSRMIPSQKDRAMMRQEVETIEAKGREQRRLITLMGQTLHEEMKMRLTTQNQMLAMSLSQEKIAHFIQLSESVYETYTEKLLKFCEDFVDACDKINHFPPALKEQALGRLQEALVGQMRSLDACLRDFEATAPRQYFR